MGAPDLLLLLCGSLVWTISWTFSRRWTAAALSWARWPSLPTTDDDDGRWCGGGGAHSLPTWVRSDKIESKLQEGSDTASPASAVVAGRLVWLVRARA